MTPFSKPLVALSLTELDETLLRYTEQLSRRFGWDEIHFVHVPRPDAAAVAVEPQHWTDRLQEAVERCFGQPIPQFRPTYHVVEGSRLDQLVILAARHDRDLILLGHRRAHTHRRPLARRLAMIAPCSVWLVPEGSLPQISSILAATDFSSHSEDSLSVALQIARASGLDQLQALHVFFNPSTARYDEQVQEAVAEQEAEFEKFLSAVDAQGIRVERILQESTHPAQAILRVAERSGADLIVMSTRGRSRAACVLLGSITSQALSETTLPLLAVKHEGSHMSLMRALLDHRLWEQRSPKTN